MVTKTQKLVPLIDIQDEEFARQYEQGVWWAMHGDEQGNGPYPDGYLVECLKIYEEHGFFERNEWLEHIGFYIGVIHGGVLLLRTGQLLPDITTLVRIEHPQFRRGYRVGREAYFHETDTPGANYLTERNVIEWLSNLVIENPYQEKDHADTWYYSVGNLLGELSGQLFPETLEERQHWQKEVEAYQRRKEAVQQPQHTQELQSATALQQV